MAKDRWIKETYELKAGDEVFIVRRSTKEGLADNGRTARAILGGFLEYRRSQREAVTKQQVERRLK